ncbi:MAG: N-acetylmuramoyl-L-alanine amidase [Pseudomonadota bacterium]
MSAAGISQGKARYEVREVVLHTAAIEDPGAFLERFPTAPQVHAEIDSWHKANGWRGFGYHYGIMPDGTVFSGRRETEIGAHVKEANRGTIGIVMINVRRHAGITKFSDYFTNDQRRAVRGLIADINDRASLERVTGHNQYAPKECPGFRVVSEHWLPAPSWWSRLIRRLS